MTAQARPRSVVYCHCTDCRRWTGAVLAGFASFDRDDLDADPALGAPFEHNPGVERWSCGLCHAPLAAAFAYLPGQIYVPLGLFDALDALAPEHHCHADAAPSWLHVADDLPRSAGTARGVLRMTRP